MTIKLTLRHSTANFLVPLLKVDCFSTVGESDIVQKDEHGNKKMYVRTSAGYNWEDPTLAEWPENDYRIFVGDLGNEVRNECYSGPCRMLSCDSV